MSRVARRTFALGISLAVLCMIPTLVAPAAETVFQQKPLTAYFKEHDWLALSIPDSKMQPGSVIKVKKLNDFIEVQWLGDIRKCGVNDEQLGFVRGKYPSVGIGESFAVTASITASILNLFHVNTSADKVSGAVFTMEDAGGDAIDFLAFSIWASNQGSRLQTACSNLLGQDDVFLVTESFRISKGSYQLLDKNGAKIGLSASVAGRSLDGQLQGSIGTNGELKIAGDFYFGVRRAKLLSGVFTTLGNAQQDVPEADDLLLLAQ
jgi:hypothetical protein